MGAWVDRDERAREIHTAAIALIKKKGYSDFSLRALADALGGSITLVTHYFPTHAELMRSILEFQLQTFDEDLRRLEKGVDELERFRILVD